MHFAESTSICAEKTRPIVEGGADPQTERLEARRISELVKRDSIEALCEAFIERHAKVRKRTWRDDQLAIRYVAL